MDNKPLWDWCTVSAWFADNGLVRVVEHRNAEVVAAINTALDALRQRERDPVLARSIARELQQAD
ncbi:MAG: hypothetical protein KC983_01565, partial [Phycisphaerales bacterium]|nr:hypothetical protein [Phycisphaerales bacterium]